MARLQPFNSPQGFQKLANFNAQMNKQAPSQYGSLLGSQFTALGSQTEEQERAKNAMGGLRDLYNSFTVSGQTPDSNQVNQLKSYIQKNIASGDLDPDALKFKSFGDPFINSINTLMRASNRTTNFGRG